MLQNIELSVLIRLEQGPYQNKWEELGEFWSGFDHF